MTSQGRVSAQLSDTVSSLNAELAQTEGKIAGTNGSASPARCGRS